MQDLLSWAQRWHYPQLVLNERDVIPYGETNWRTFARTANLKRKRLAWKRIERWNELAGVDTVEVA